MQLRLVAFAVSGIIAAVHGVRTLSNDRHKLGARAAALGQIAAGAAALLLAAIGGLNPESVSSIVWPWVGGAIALAYGSMIAHIVQIARASRTRRLSEAQRLARYLDRPDSPDHDAA